MEWGPRGRRVGAGVLGAGGGGGVLCIMERRASPGTRETLEDPRVAIVVGRYFLSSGGGVCCALARRERRRWEVLPMTRVTLNNNVCWCVPCFSDGERGR